MRNYYKVLGVPENASLKEIKTAYQKYVRQWHPDLNPHDPLANEMMKMYNEAYSVLSDPGKRASHDMSIGVRHDNAPPDGNETNREAEGSASETPNETKIYQQKMNEWNETITRSYSYGGGMNSDSFMSAYSTAFAEPRRNHPFVRGNFVVSVWLLIGFCAFTAVKYILHAAEIMEATHPYAPRFFAWPFVTGFIELALWYRFFKERERGSRLFAGFIGVVMLLMQVLVPLIVTDLYGYTLRKLQLFFFLYIAVSHLGFAVWGREYD